MPENSAPEPNTPSQDSNQRPMNLSQSTEEMLREEIRTTQRPQSDILKWKFIAIAAVGAFALKTAQDQKSLSIGLLGLIPLICLYADVLCFHYILRVITIGAFIKKSYQEMRAGKPDQLLDYEGFVFSMRGRRTVDSPFGLETLAVIGSSCVINVLLLLLFVALILQSGVCNLSIEEWALGASPGFCLIGTWRMFSQYSNRFEAILKTPLHENAAEGEMQ